MALSTPSTTPRCPTITLPISSRIAPSFFWKAATSSRAFSVSVMLGLSFRVRMAGPPYLARPNQLKIASDVETVAGRDVVLVEHLLRHRLVFREDVLVALADEAALGRTVDDLGAGGAFTTVDAGRTHVVRSHVEVLRIAGERAVVGVAVAVAGLGKGRSGRADRLGLWRLALLGSLTPVPGDRHATRARPAPELHVHLSGAVLAWLAFLAVAPAAAHERARRSAAGAACALRRPGPPDAAPRGSSFRRWMSSFFWASSRPFFAPFAASDRRCARALRGRCPRPLRAFLQRALELLRGLRELAVEVGELLGTLLGAAALPLQVLELSLVVLHLLLGLRGLGR